MALAQLALFSGDRVGLLVYGQHVQQRVLPNRGHAHLRQIVEALAQARAESSEADHLRATAVLGRLQPRRSLILWVTDLAETAMRPENARWPQWTERQTLAVTRGLDALERDCSDWGDEFLIGQIAALCAVGYVEFRKTTDWRAGRPNLAAWMDGLAARASVAATIPKD